MFACSLSSTSEEMALPAFKEPTLHHHTGHNFESEALDNNSQYPDYTILPSNKERTWYLEAKAWNVQLLDKQAQQGMGYAYHNAGKWVVLSNGHTWRLYDSQVHALAPDRLVLEVRLEDTDAMAGFLKALTKESVLSGGLEQYAQTSRLRRELSSQLTDENSEAIKALQKVLRSRPGLSAVSRAQVRESLLQRTSSNRVEPPPVPGVDKHVEKPELPVVSPEGEACQICSKPVATLTSS